MKRIGIIFVLTIIWVEIFRVIMFTIINENVSSEDILIHFKPDLTILTLVIIILLKIKRRKWRRK